MNTKQHSVCLGRNVAVCSSLHLTQTNKAREEHCHPCLAEGLVLVSTFCVTSNSAEASRGSVWAQNLSTFFIWLQRYIEYTSRPKMEVLGLGLQEERAQNPTMKGASRRPHQMCTLWQVVAWEAPKVPRQAGRWAGTSSTAISERDTAPSSSKACTNTQSHSRHTSLTQKGDGRRQ